LHLSSRPESFAGSPEDLPDPLEKANPLAFQSHPRADPVPLKLFPGISHRPHKQFLQFHLLIRRAGLHNALNERSTIMHPIVVILPMSLDSQTLEKVNELAVLLVQTDPQDGIVSPRLMPKLRLLHRCNLLGNLPL